jgi:ribosomal protein S18 acetylase RimI-like enzyme
MRTEPTHRLTLRPATDGDREFLVGVYASTRLAELAVTGWSGAEIDAFLRMQFDHQDRHYAVAFAEAERSVIEVDGRPAGRLYVDRRPDEIRVVDIALLPEFRGRGVGGSLLGELAEEASASGRPIRIHVERENPAMSLYLRLGFVQVDDEGEYLLMERAA